MSEENVTENAEAEVETEEAEEYEAPSITSLLEGPMGPMLTSMLGGMMASPPALSYDLEGRGIPMGVFRDIATLVVFHVLMSKAPKSANEKQREQLLNNILEATGRLTAELCATKQLAESIDMSGNGEEAEEDEGGDE